MTDLKTRILSEISRAGFAWHSDDERKIIDAIMTALSKPASEPAGGDVAAVAKIIDPEGFKLLAEGKNLTSGQAVTYRDAYGKAHLILAALSSSAGPAEQVDWRDVVGFEGLYEVSDQGQIRSVKNGRILATHTMGDGYVKAEFWKEGVRTQTSAHRVVARAFLGEPPEGKPEVNHKDGDKLNNTPSNLEWCSRAENNEHSRYVLGNDVKPVTATDIETGVVESFPSIAEAGRRAPATVEMREALQAAEPFIELLHSLTGEKRARAIVWKALKQVRAALAPATEGSAPRLRRVRHVRRGSEYEVLGEGEVQISNPEDLVRRYSRILTEGDELVVYRACSDGKLWLRFPDEFADGRFVDI